MRWLRGNDKHCRRCGAGLETVRHVIQRCGPHAVAIQMRHNDVLNRLIKASRHAGSIRVNQRVEGVDEELASLRLDIVYRDEGNRRIAIVNVAVPFKNRSAAFDNVRGEKLAKYFPLAENLRRQGYDVVVEAFLVEALGAWDPENKRISTLLGISRFYAKLMRRLMVSETIRWSRNIYVEHVLCKRQYQDVMPNRSTGDQI